MRIPDISGGCSLREQYNCSDQHGHYHSCGALYGRNGNLQKRQEACRRTGKEAESAVAGKNDGELPAIDAKMLEPYFTALGLEPPKDKNRNKYTIDTRNDRDMALKNKYEPMS